MKSIGLNGQDQCGLTLFMKSIDLNGKDKWGFTIFMNVVFFHFHKMRLLLWIFKHCAKRGGVSNVHVCNRYSRVLERVWSMLQFEH